MKTGIDSISFDVAKIHLPIKTLAKARNIEPEKLEKGLGLIKMTLPDIHQDTVVFAANALTKLTQENNLNLNEIARIYVGTESAIDSSKPISSFLIALMEQKFGENTLSECDVVDFTFACIGGVDALQNCLDFVKLNPTKKAIVVTTDFAKYDLNSTGEYTQGAGALAMLITSNPRIIAFDNNWATSTKGVFDFFKPFRTLSKEEITENKNNESWFDNLEAEIEIHKDQPVFDGQYSNQCYMDRTRNAYFSLKKLKNTDETIYNSWESIIMHLPYAFQGRRMLSEIYALDAESKTISGNEDASEYQNKLKGISKSEEYQRFVNEKLMPAELASSLIGNLYTGSIFMGLLSTLAHFYDTKKEISNSKFGFLAYGSGSKSKVFEGTIQPDWKAAITNVNLFETLEESLEIDFPTYEKLHKKEQKQSIQLPKNEWILNRIEKEIPNLLGARYYKWVD
ncbi:MULTISPECIES: hydroxymethylglutaryl-CoA synthase family protein [Flavobacterium]|uniref:Hydroxymethylglutaryl-CoA synthase family protein n=1 Tax=Flavobacterium gawalongense TaxID=2594432 RepID=A0A553BTS7_9FLAO|nr:hydroxymethylglutaryl-CoA synthase [Flavobacterium gawalongense]TRX02263.1 hydroxymethylglutaryl-CoA synthase family protein [Flavobacterium gawalongense]TRX07491.1 hydroxymethylglutaryl-CoA synthase family protein [Flavobacterium gawalongense]TRX11664.1 hydroxymethylglutaryl-CoA synthase family protein [Flavobacterium gawalongense]TRX12333.1 hydroxymethylglutaryl-CoA synthase family protein [Flavobacterium gawalongense]TRX30402.1 hydroxymethylglutaryl-CoA synthase family protein [Flavobact